MPAALPIRDDRSPAALRRLARRERDGRVSARLVALANALEGLPREEAARLAGMTGQTLRDWVRRYNSEGLEGLADHHRSGRPCALDEGQQATLKAMILRGPELERDGCVEWRIADLRRIAHARFSVAHAETGMLRLVKSLNLSWQKARPRHPRADHKPANLTLTHLLPYSPELNPVEKLWQHLRERFFSHRVLPNLAAVIDAACNAWNRLVAEPGRVQSLTAFPWLPPSVITS